MAQTKTSNPPLTPPSRGHSRAVGYRLAMPNDDDRFRRLRRAASPRPPSLLQQSRQHSSNLDNPAKWAIRISTGFAFLVKASLISAVGVAAVQEIWAVLRKKFMKLRGIDAMFAVLTSPLAFLVPDLWVYAKVLTVMAIVSWCVYLCFFPWDYCLSRASADSQLGLSL
jgi:hypothetical protein